MVVCVLAAGCTGGKAATDDANVGPGGPDDSPGASCEVQRSSLPRARLWRLTVPQYINSLESVFGKGITNKKLPIDPSTPGSFATFDNVASAASVDDQLLTAYREVAGDVAINAKSRLTSDWPCLVSQPASQTCAESFVKGLGQKLFRRALDSEELQRHLAFFKNSESRWNTDEAVALTLEAMLLSPRFLYRSELGQAEDGLQVLTQDELASELSYLIADMPPDNELVELAVEGKLKDVDVRLQQARRLAELPQAHDKLERFFFQALHLQPLSQGGLAKDTDRFPQWSASLQASMVQETETFLDSMVWNEQATLHELFSAEHSYIDQNLASLYGIALPENVAPFSRIKLPPHRKGLVGHGGLLATLSHAEDTSVAHRGLLFSQALLCQPIASPPAGAADQASLKLFNPNDKEATARQHFEFAQTNARECTSCHQQFAWFGLGLENFDAIGAHRTETQFKRAIDTKITLTDQGDLDGTYDSSIELAGAIAASPRGQVCFAAQMASFGFGKEFEPEAQSCELERLVAPDKEQPQRVADMLINLAALPSFSLRQGGEQ